MVDIKDILKVPIKFSGKMYTSSENLMVWARAPSVGTSDGARERERVRT